MTTKIKICGITLVDDAARASAAGADFIGLNFWPKSKRYLMPSRAPLLAGAARGAGSAQIVGVFVDAGADEVAAVMQEVDLDIIQLHGDESPADVAAIAAISKRPVWKALAARSTHDVARLEHWPADAILLDTPTPDRGGSGETFDWEIAREARRRHPARLIVLAGGLRPDNVAAAISAVQPWAIDVASGVETGPGVKDAAKLAALMTAARATHRG
jgi:phosphoribosylanthranilate isomerase